MGLLHTFNEWRASRYENHVAKMKEDNKCPDCYGRGFLIYPANELVYYSNSMDCPGCSGSGDFNDWNNHV